MPHSLLSWFSPAQPAPPLANPSQISRQYARHRATVLLCITLGYAASYTCRLGLSVVKKPLIDAHLFSASQLGQIGSAMFYTYALAKLVNGFLADHADVRKFFATGLLASALINLAMGSAPVFSIWLLLWGLNGWFQGFGAPASAVTLAHWFPPHQRGRYYGIWSLAHSLGEGLTFVCSALLAAHLGWRAAFTSPALLCTLAATLIFLFMKDRPASVGLPPVSPAAARGTGFDPVLSDRRGGIPPPSTPPSSSPPCPSVSSVVKSSLLTSQLAIFRLPSFWVLGLASATMYVPRYAINNWAILFLQESKSYSLVEASSFLALNNLTGMAGAVVYGFLSDTVFHARRPPATLLFGLLQTGALAMILYLPTGHPVLLSLAFAVFGFTLSGLLAVLGGLHALDLVPKSHAGAAMGIIGVFSYLGAAVNDSLTGHLLDEHISHAADGSITHDFSTASAFWLASSIASVLLAATLWNAKPREADENVKT